MILLLTALWSIFLCNKSYNVDKVGKERSNRLIMTLFVQLRMVLDADFLLCLVFTAVAGYSWRCLLLL